MKLENNPGKCLMGVDSNTVRCYRPRMTGEYSLEELAETVRDWAERHQVYPANGQAAEAITERTIRYYRTLGLLDPPLGAYVRSFSDKHKLQLMAIRLFQAQGLPLRRIRDELYGKSLEDLEALEKQAVKTRKRAAALSLPFAAVSGGESWQVTPLDRDFLLISRSRQALPRTVIEQINQLLQEAAPQAPAINKRS